MLQSWLARPFHCPADLGDVCPAQRPSGWLTLPGRPFLLMWCRHCHLISRETKLGPQVWVPFSVPYPSNPRKSLGVSEFYFHTRPHMMLSSPVCGGGNQNLKIRKTKLYCQPWPSGSFLLISPPSLLLLCPTLCNPIDGSPSGSTVPGTLQAGTLEWVAISFSSA